MEFGAIIAVFGTLAGALIVGIMTYLVQKSVSERQRKWAIEDEKRSIRRDILATRVEPIYEAVGIMMEGIGNYEAKSLGIPVYSDSEKMKEKGMRLQEIVSPAWASIEVIGSEELKDKWRTLSMIYWGLRETGDMGADDIKTSTGAHIEMVKILDDIKAS